MALKDSLWKKMAQNWHLALYPWSSCVWWKHLVLPACLLAVFVFYALVVSHNATSYEHMTHEWISVLWSNVSDSSWRGHVIHFFNPHNYESNGMAVFYIYEALERRGKFDVYAIRLISACCGLVCLGGVAWLFARKSEKCQQPHYRLAALLAALWLASNVFFLGYTSFARFYAFSSVCNVLALACLVAACERNRWWIWAGYVIAWMLAIASMVMSVLAVVCHACLVWGLAERSARRRFCVCAGLGLVLFALLWAIDGEGLARMGRTGDSVGNTLQAISLHGSNPDSYPYWVRHLDFCSWERAGSSSINCWLDGSDFYMLRASCVLIWTILVGRGLRQAYQLIRFPRDSINPDLGDLVALGLTACSVILALAYWWVGFLFQPLDLAWICPLVAVAWASLLARCAPLRYLRHPRSIPGLFVLLEEGNLETKPEYAYLTRVLAYLQRYRLAEIRVDRRRNLYWVRPLVSVNAEETESIVPGQVSPAELMIPATILAPRWQQSTPPY